MEYINPKNCPECGKPVSQEYSNRMNCGVCMNMNCKRKVHLRCLLGKNVDKLICPACGSNEIAYCDEPDVDINKDIAENTNIRGGRKLRKLRKSRKSRKSRKHRKTKKHRKYRK